MSYTIRKMIAADSYDVARISTEGWKFAYKGIFPDRFLDKLDINQRTQNWMYGINNNSPDILRIVLEENGKVLAFACGKENRDKELVPKADAEIWAIYTDPAYIGKGLGTRIFDEFKSEMKAFGFKFMLVWSLKENQLGRSFYESRGGQLINQTKTFKIDEGEFEEVGYLFSL